MAPSRPLIGCDPAWLDVMRDVDLVAPYDEPVLLTGQTGTGKSYLAREIHRRSPRAEKPFLTLDCTSLTRDLVEMQLLGIEKNTASQVAARAGYFELADGGTLFIDELGDLPLEMQPKLLHVLQTGEVQRIGAVKPVIVNVRVIAATNADLAQMVQAKRFREDLYWRLARLRLELPALGERPLDVAEFARAEVARANEQRVRARRPEAQLSDAALRALQAHDWSTDVDGLGGDGGGLRELFSVVWRAMIAADRAARPGEPVTIEPAHLCLPSAPPPERRARRATPTTRARRAVTGRARAVVEALEHAPGGLDADDLAERTGIGRSTILRWIKNRVLVEGEHFVKRPVGRSVLFVHPDHAHG